MANECKATEAGNAHLRVQFESLLSSLIVTGLEQDLAAISTGFRTADPDISIAGRGVPLALHRQRASQLRFLARAAIRPPFWNRPAGHAVAVRNAFRAMVLSDRNWAEANKRRRAHPRRKAKCPR
jgi:hypothetical protein